MTAPAHASTHTTALDGPPVEQQVAKDMVRRALPAVPVLLFLAAIPWGIPGALSSAYAVALVLVNFLFSAALLSYTARISLGLMMAAALGGYLVRLAVICGAVLLVKDLSWVELWPLGLTIVLTHLGLLVWELRYLSISMAFPGLRPAPQPAAQRKG